MLTPSSHQLQMSGMSCKCLAWVAECLA